MIALDTSSLIAYLVDLALAHKRAVLPPPVVTEIFSNPALSPELSRYLADLPILEIQEGFWERAGRVRAKVLAKGLRVCVADALIAQACIDHKVPLLTRDQDFSHFAKSCGLTLASPY